MHKYSRRVNPGAVSKERVAGSLVWITQIWQKERNTKSNSRVECIYEQKIIVKVLYVEYSHVMCSIILCVKNSKQLLGCEVQKVLCKYVSTSKSLFLCKCVLCVYINIHSHSHTHTHTHTHNWLHFEHAFEYSVCAFTGWLCTVVDDALLALGQVRVTGWEISTDCHCGRSLFVLP